MRRIRIAAVLTLVTATMVSAQRFARSWGACRSNWDADNYFVSPFFAGNPTYDGRVTFARIKYRGDYECGREGPGWAHDYPRTESHFVRILRDISAVTPFVEAGPITGGAVVRLDAPALSYYPIAYLSEPGGWNMSEAEVTGLRNYIQRGGFIIFDDIEGALSPDYENLVVQWRRAFPEAIPIRLTNEHRDLPLVLQHRPVEDSEQDRPIRAGVHGHLRGQRSDEAPGGDHRQLRGRRRAHPVLG
ncbi:MAG TPA: DUF4159 domain-containing protein [Gemmatimonadaceae bacterium]|nr:DUF4159 domain-containing protein [Gemmatimonadaceae bacterium]